MSDHIFKVPVLIDEEGSQLTWITQNHLNQWGISEMELWQRAAANQNQLLDGIALEVKLIQDNKLGMIPLDSPLKASIILAPNFIAWVKADLGDTVLAVVPCRDFIYVIKEDYQFLGRLGSVVVEEFLNSGYPISPEVLHNLISRNSCMRSLPRKSVRNETELNRLAAGAPRRTRCKDHLIQTRDSAAPCPLPIQRSGHADALPQDLLRRWLEELKPGSAGCQPVVAQDVSAAELAFRRRCEEALDAGHGSCLLR